MIYKTNKQGIAVKMACVSCARMNNCLKCKRLDHDKKEYYNHACELLQIRKDLNMVGTKFGNTTVGRYHLLEKMRLYQLERIQYLETKYPDMIHDNRTTQYRQYHALKESYDYIVFEQESIKRSEKATARKQVEVEKVLMTLDNVYDLARMVISDVKPKKEVKHRQVLVLPKMKMIKLESKRGNDGTPVIRHNRSIATIVEFTEHPLVTPIYDDGHYVSMKEQRLKKAQEDVDRLLEPFKRKQKFTVDAVRRLTEGGWAPSEIIQWCRV